MTEKFVDLAQKIALDWGYMSSEAWRALDWLDDHPDQVPGRTITESELAENREIYGDSYRAGFKGAGGAVVPDPEPTNFERLENLVDQWRKGPRLKLLTQYLDEAGVTAPGDGDER